MNKLNKAIILSAKIHSGKKGRNNEPAVLHSIRVMNQMKSNKGKIVGVLHDVVETEKISITQQESFSTTSSLGALLVVAYKYRDKPRMSLEEKISEKAADIKLDLERNLNMLGIIASISPLLGLLGTVVGMITVFANINLLGTSSNADFLASGISEALITTAFGLIVAVPGLVFYRMFQHKVDKLMINLQNQTKYV